MANTFTIAAQLSTAIAGAPQIGMNVNKAYTMAGGDATLLTGTATTTPTAIDLGACANIGAVIILAGTGTGSQSLIVSLDNPATQLISEGIPEGMFILLTKPPATIYVSVASSTLGYSVALVER